MAYKKIPILGTPVIKEYTANAAITPGHLCEIMSTGKVRVHSTAGGTAQKMFALEDSLQGKEIGDAYTAANVCQLGIFRPGDEVFALLYNGETAVIGSKLESQGDGTLRVVDADASTGDVGIQSIVGIALQAVDMSGSSGVDPSARIRIEIL
jgi:hypothetical protein